MLVTIIRTCIMYVFVVGALRMMGKRQIGELEASELVVTIIISDIAAMPITNMEVPLVSNIAAIMILMILEVLLSYLAYKQPKARGFLYGRPSTFYENGRFDQQEMLKQRFNVADIMEEVRGNGACSLEDVDFIVMETNGKVSVILKSDSSPVTPQQLKIKSEPVKMSYIIIDNGNIIKECMEHLGLNDDWLKNCLKKHGVKSASDVFYLSFERDSGKVVLVPMEKR